MVDKASNPPSHRRVDTVREAQPGWTAAQQKQHSREDARHRMDSPPAPPLAAEEVHVAHGLPSTFPLGLSVRCSQRDTRVVVWLCDECPCRTQEGIAGSGQAARGHSTPWHKPPRDGGPRPATPARRSIRIHTRCASGFGQQPRPCPCQQRPQPAQSGVVWGMRKSQTRCDMTTRD